MKILINSFVVLIIVGVTLGGGIGGSVSQAQANLKSEELKQKVADISLLSQQLGQRIEQAGEIRKAFDVQKQAISDEINVLRNNHENSSGIPAEDALRIHYNTELLSAIAAYSKQIDAKILFYQTGQDKLAYLRTMALDDIKLIDTLNDLEIDALTTQISLVINVYLAEAHIIRLEPVALTSPDPEAIWQPVSDDRK
jgi:hypothetical protein